jgi:acetoin utilization protein AcuC
MLAVVAGRPVDPRREIPPSWVTVAERIGLPPGPPTVMTDGVNPIYQAWQPDGAEPLDRAIAATRTTLFPLHGLDPDDPRD